MASTERERVMAAAPPWLRCWLLLCSDLAIRSGTAARLGLQHYDADRQELSFRTKFESAQTLPVTDELRVLLDAAVAIAAEQGDGTRPFVSLLHPNGSAKYGCLIKAFHALRGRLGITRRLIPHDLRRTTAVRTLEITRDLRLVQALLGHHNLDTTLYYLDHRNTPVSRATLEAAKLNRKLGEPS